MRKLSIVCLALALYFVAASGQAAGPCTIYETCDNGTVISCQGTSVSSTCSSDENDLVTCDQTTTYCGCTASIVCPTGVVASCSIPSGPSPTTGLCTSGPDWVKCGSKKLVHCPQGPIDPF